MKWNILNSQQPSSTQELLQLILDNRNIENPDLFFNPTEPEDITPKLVGIDQEQLRLAVARIKQAVAAKHKVVIFGDYDADGITAASIIWLTLSHMGLKAQPFIPDRHKHGYGISIRALQEIVATDKPDLIITVDNGIVAHKPLEWAREQNIDVVVTDHHQPEDKLPPAKAIVHSTRVCGAAVAWLLMRQLQPDFSLNLIDLVGIATITDQMPLINVNRSLVIAGLNYLQQTQKAGLRALYDVANINPKQITSYTVGFVIGPRINAAGRISQGIEAMRLLCTARFSAAKKIAKKLEKTNQERQALTKTQLDIALEQAQDQLQQNLIITASEQFHEGIIGLIAGKITEKFYKPSIALALEGDQAKASARSVSGVDITKLIRTQQDLLLSAGGHKQAAGFSLKVENLQAVRDNLQQQALETVSHDSLEPKLKIDLMLPDRFLNLKTARKINGLAPFGIGNSSPVFALKKVRVVQTVAMGRDNNHLRLLIRINEGDYQTLTAIGWNMAEKAENLKEGTEIDIAFSLDINHWKGNTKLQLKLKDIKL